MHHGKSGLHCAKAYYGVIPKPYDPLYIYIMILFFCLLPKYPRKQAFLLLYLVGAV
jgi:hypothetical protein